MNLSLFINEQTLNSNFEAILKRYDKDNNGFTQEEFSNAVSGMTTKFAKKIIKLIRFDKKYFKILDTDENKLITENEFASYIQREYKEKLNYYDFKQMTVREICNEIEKADKLIEQEKKNMNSSDKNTGNVLLKTA